MGSWPLLHCAYHVLQHCRPHIDIIVVLLYSKQDLLHDIAIHVYMAKSNRAINLVFTLKLDCSQLCGKEFYFILLYISNGVRSLFFLCICELVHLSRERSVWGGSFEAPSQHVLIGF